MNIIERAGGQLHLKSSKSTIERAIEKSTAETTPPTPPSQSAAEQTRRREKRRQITLDHERLRKFGFAMPGDQSPTAEEFRLIKRPLVDAAFHSDVQAAVRNRNILMVTSARPNEGKTYVAINLAFSIASEHDVHVLLVDGDLARPMIPILLGFDANRGLIDVVSDDSVDLSDVMIRTNIPNIY